MGIEKSLKSLPASLKKEEVIQLIDKATSNFLKTVKSETSSCGEKVKDCEEQAKAGMEKLKKSIEENEKFFRKELWQIREQTDKNSREVSRSLSDQQAKINSTVNSQELLQKRVETDLKNIGEMNHKDESKGID